MRLGGDDAEIFMEKFRGSCLLIHMHVIYSMRVGWVSLFPSVGFGICECFLPAPREIVLCVTEVDA